MREKLPIEGNPEYDVDAIHSCSLPGISCDLCNSKWSTTGIQYPTIGCDIFTGIQSLSNLTPIAVEVFSKLLFNIRPILPQNIELLPGTEFGPLIGCITGHWNQTVWPNPWTLLLQNNCYEILSRVGFNLMGCQAQLRKPGHKNCEELTEVEVHIGCELHPSCLQSPSPIRCIKCGRLGITKPQNIILEASSIKNTFIQRIRSLPTALVVSEEFMKAIIALGIEDITFSAIEVI